ncbi:type II toxin-antitoxin system VapC family toxin [Rhizobium sp. S152]|uniref:type II toxin-antitoxin system VapC family toxin n=1 Tax=Rhizobium sp. S152 TaxID=3055038 RepID=UPI0025A93E7E|nr:type II toxin-antitoxin system VapC family toxin [Rhizobium sp. S152]MDM9627305.1 type II toxin-antitoxin system VapC family toxin [Rhizobium sp. S152]
MIYVVDASAAIAWFVPEPEHVDADFLLGSSVRRVAPDLIFAEVANVLQRKVRLGQITPQQAVDGLTTLDHSIDVVLPSQALVKSGFALSRKLDHSVYDCMYLAATLSTDDSFLVTSDVKFLTKAHAAGEGGRIRTLEAAHALFVSEQENKNG